LLKEPGMAAHIYTALGKNTKQEDHKFKASLGYIIINIFREIM
jgi:hypothetical protein